MYLTYSEYQALGGGLPEQEFNNLELKAETLINWYTFNRLTKEVPEKERSGLMGRNITCQRPFRSTSNLPPQVSRGSASPINPLPAAFD